MPDFRIRAHADAAPGCCLICGSDAGPFVEVVPELDLIGFGRVYLCARNDDQRTGCVVQMARLAGSLGAAEADALRRDLAECMGQITIMDDELERAGEPVVLSKAAHDRLVEAAMATDVDAPAAVAVVEIVADEPDTNGGKKKK